MPHILLVFATCFVFATCLLCLSSCQKAAPAPEGKTVKALLVKAERPEGSPRLAGEVAAHTYVNASFRLAGKVAVRLAAVGDTVTKGQELARLDEAVQSDALSAARADAEAARAALKQSERHAARTARLVRVGAVSHNEQEIAKRQFEAARAQFEAAQARSHSAGEQLDYTILRAPVDGQIVARLIENDEVVAAGQVAFKIASGSGKDALFDMPENLLARLSPGGLIEVCLDSRPDVCTRATLNEISPEADPATLTYRVKALLEDAGAMPLGAVVSGRLPASEEGRIYIPASALSNVGGQPAVWTIDPVSSTVHSRPVSVGRYTKSTVEISAGLTPGESIVAAGVQDLLEGQKVRTL